MGSLTYAGVELAQLTNYSIILGQEDYCDSLELPLPNRVRQAADEEMMTAGELAQTRGLLMKCQWRAVQSAPQHCARVGLANSATAHSPTVARLQEATKIAKEVKKESKDKLTFHNFNTS